MYHGYRYYTSIYYRNRYYICMYIYITGTVNVLFAYFYINYPTQVVAYTKAFLEVGY